MKKFSVLCVAAVLGLLSSQIFAEKSDKGAATCPGHCASASKATCQGECEGKCQGECQAKCQGECEGKCEGECQAKCEGKCEGECQGKCEGDGQECPVTTAMAALPKMTYRVGDQTLCCDQAAAKLAEESKEHIQFVVAEKEYDAQPAAMLALADVTEKFVEAYVTPHTCKVSGKTSVCGTESCCSATAGKMVAVAKAAMDEVQMTYQVGDEACSCPNQADSLAKEQGAKKQYVIGDTNTCCAIDARIKLAHAKYKAAVQALAKAQQDAATANATTSS